MLGEGESRPAGVLPDHRHNREFRQLDAGIGGGDQRIVPVLDLAQKDTGIGTSREPKSLRHAGDVVSKRHSPCRHGQHDHAVRNLRNLVILHGGVTGAKVHLLLILDIAADESPDALAAADAIVSDHGLGMGLLVGGEPLFVDQGGKRCPCSSQKDAAGRNLGFGLLRALRRTGKKIAQECQCRQGQQEVTGTSSETCFPIP